MAAMQLKDSFVGYTASKECRDRPWIANVYQGGTAIHRCFATEAAALAYVASCQQEYRKEPRRPRMAASASNEAAMGTVAA